MSRLDELRKMGEQSKENKNAVRKENNSYDDIIDSIMNRPDAKNLQSSSKEIADIDVSLIDTDEINEQLFGYEDLEKIETSFNTIGNNSVIYVYRRKNGRYLCYAGNQRLIATKKRGDKTITCVISGDEPTEAERIEQLIFMNAQRTPRPYYIAKQLSEYEKLLRRKGKTNVTELIEEKFGYKKAMQKRYQQILKLDNSLQELFKKENVPFSFLLEKCSKLPTGKEDEFAYVLSSMMESEELTTDLITRAYAIATGKERSNKEEKPKPVKTSQAFKELVSIPYTPDTVITIPDEKKEIIVKQATEMQSYLQKIIDSCKA